MTFATAVFRAFISHFNCCSYYQI